jgi:hypothetical protein
VAAAQGVSARRSARAERRGAGDAARVVGGVWAGPVLRRVEAGFWWRVEAVALSAARAAGWQQPPVEASRSRPAARTGQAVVGLPPGAGARWWAARITHEQACASAGLTVRRITRRPHAWRVRTGLASVHVLACVQAGGRRAPQQRGARRRSAAEPASAAHTARRGAAQQPLGGAAPRLRRAGTKRAAAVAAATRAPEVVVSGDGQKEGRCRMKGRWYAFEASLPRPLPSEHPQDGGAKR